jgi:hypothetical protein
MRWLLIAFLVSLLALLFATAGVAYHISRQRTRKGSESSSALEPIDESDAEAKH